MQTTNLAWEGQGLGQLRKTASVIGFIVVFAVIARGAHDIWAATLVYLAILSLTVFFLIQSARGRIGPLRFPLLIPSVIFLAALLISYSRASNLSESFLALMDVMASVLLFIISVNVFQAPGTFAVFLAWLIPCLWFETMLVVVSIISTYIPAASTWWITSYPLLNYFLPVPEIFYAGKMGTLVNANLFAAFTLPLFVLFGLYVWNRRSESGTRSYYWISGFVAAALCLLSARSFSSWLSLVIALFCLAAYFYGRPLIEHRRKTTMLIIAIVMVTVSGLVAYKLTRKVDLSIDPHRNNLNRVYWWYSALQMFRDYPATGVGLGNFGSAYLSYKVSGTENTLYAHGLPFTLLSETGLVGMVTFLILVGAFVRRTFYLVPHRIRSHPELLALLAVMLFYMINIGIEYLVNLLIIAVLTGKILADMPTPAIKPRLSAAIVMMALVIAFVPTLLSPFFASRLLVSGQTFLKAGDVAQAEKNFTDAIALNPQAWEPYVELARISKRRLDLGAALQWQQKAAERNKLSLPLQRELESYQRLDR